MDAEPQIELDTLIVGGGVAGLWLTDELRRRKQRVLLVEAHRLGSGQTSCAQGILHGGLKYSLAGLLSQSARMVREMPALWQAMLRGSSEPRLDEVKLSSAWCYLWRGQSLKSWTAMLAAVAALQVKPVALSDDQVPRMLVGCPRPIYRLDEQVIDPRSLLEVLARRNAGLVWQAAGGEGIEFSRNTGEIAARVRGPNDRTATLLPRYVVLAAGAGNAGVREQLELSGSVMQRRPLRVALVRGDLPALNGHCVDGAKTRVTITSACDSSSRVVWQLGGQISEVGVDMPREAFLALAKRELSAVLPGWPVRGFEWTELAVDRAERSTDDGLMPGDVQVIRDGNVYTVWPTKLVMAPLLGQKLAEQLAIPSQEPHPRWQQQVTTLNWPPPQVEPPPWERSLAWTLDN